MTALEHVLDREVTIAARRETVFRYFTDSERFAAWWGAGSRIEPRPGGAVMIRFPNGVVAGGEVVEIAPVERVVFTYGFESGQPIAVGSVASHRHARGDAARHGGSACGTSCPPPRRGTSTSRAGGTSSPSSRTWWRRRPRPAPPRRADLFFACWAETDAAKRRAGLLAVATEDLAFRDPYSCTSGIDDLVAHIGASQRFMPGVVLERQGEARQCQGTALVDWVVKAADGSHRARGTNVFDLAPDGRIARVTGIWG